MNRYITIQIGTDSENNVGTPEETFATLKNCYASIKYNNGQTEFNEGAMPVSDIDFSVRYDANIVYPCRILFNSEYYKVLHIELIGRKDGMRLKTVKYD